MTRFLLGLCAALVASGAHAQTIYRCTDDSGQVMISNSRLGKNCKAIAGDAPAPVAAPAASGGSKPAPRASANPTPVDFPRVGDGVQKARDNDRRHILQQELGNEQRLLDQARKELAEQEATRPAPPADRLQPYRERAAQHERNIQALQKEIGNLR